MAYIPRKQPGQQTAGMNVLGPQEEVTQDQKEQQAAASTAGAAPSGGAVAPKPAKSGSGSGTNVQKYVQANKPATQKLATGAIKKFEGEAQATGQAVQQQQQNFMQRVAANRARMTQQQGIGEGIVQQASQLEAGQTLDPNLRTQFQGITSGAAIQDVTAPDLTASQVASNRLGQQAEQVAKGGRSELLRQAFGTSGRQYTRGQGLLDELLLAGDPTQSRRVVEGVRGAADQAASGVQDARRQSLREIAGLGQSEKELTEGLVGQATGAIGGIEGNIQDEIAAKNAQLARFGEDLSYDERLGLLGDIGVETDYLYGVDPSQFTQDYTVGQIASPEQLARASALARLTGTEQSIIPETGVQNLTQQNIQQQLAIGKGDYERQLASLNAAQRAGLSGEGGDSNIKSFKRQNTNAIIQNLMSKAQGAGGVANLSELDYLRAAEAQAHSGAGHASWGTGFFEKVAGAEKSRAELQQQMLNKVLDPQFEERQALLGQLHGYTPRTASGRATNFADSVVKQLAGKYSDPLQAYQEGLSYTPLVGAKRKIDYRVSDFKRNDRKQLEDVLSGKALTDTQATLDRLKQSAGVGYDAESGQGLMYENLVRQLQGMA